MSELISAGKSRVVIQRFLEDSGLTQEQAAQHVTSAAADYAASAELRGPIDLFVGIAFFLGGAAVTVVTLSTALLHGGYAFIAYGPVIWGGHRFCVGVARFLHSRRTVRLRRD